MTRAQILPGTRLSGIYEIEHLIATGGMGEIYKGHVIETGDPVAIKTIRSELADDSAVLALFRKEASALHNLNHETIIRYYVFTRDPVLGCPYLAMEYVDGQPLSVVLRKGALRFESVLILLRRLADGLHAAHERGIIHRDIAPDNIILPGGDVAQAKIIDFGIARSTRMGAATVIGGGFAGKLNYASPEQLGLFGGEVTAKSDIYSFGLVLAEASSGRALDLGGSQFQAFEKRKMVPDLSHIDPRLRPLLECMLQPDPMRRPKTMAAIASWKIGASDPSVPRLTRRAAIGAVVLVGTAAVGVAIVWSYLFAPSDGNKPPQSTIAIPQQETAPNRTQQITRYVKEYGGGDCFLLIPHNLSENSALIQGFGWSRQAFDDFDQAFRAAQGFKAEIALREVTPAQCPLVNFLARHSRLQDKAPSFSLGHSVIRSGQLLTGTLADFDNRSIGLFLVSDDGFAHNATSYAERKVDTLSFKIPLTLIGQAPKPQVVIAIASPTPRVGFTSIRTMRLDEFVSKLEREVASAVDEIRLAVDHFTLQP